jgi:predicted nucleic acid-binding protein
LKVVVDASVIVKWVLPDAAQEEHVDQALRLLTDLRESRIEALQPPHWLLEVAAVVTRLRPEAADSTIRLLDAMELPIVADLSTLRRASLMARDLGHHLFDTLYHALALESDAVLVTADDRYLGKAKPLGHVMHLQSWRSPESSAVEVP